MPSTPAAQLDSFLDKFTDDVAAVARGSLAKLEKRLRGANRLVYDNYNALAIAFATTDRASAVIVSIALYPRWVSLFFGRGKELSDPETLLKGTGSKVRHIVLESAKDLDRPAIKALLAQAIDLAEPPLDPKGRGVLVIKSVVPKQRPRRPRGA
jgi:hypothetical protein